MPIQKLSPNFEAPVGVEANQYQYNGKELNEDYGLHWMDYGARWYDPQINRWGQIDPLAEKYLNISPYAYAGNNPLFFLDPNEKEIINAHLAFSGYVDFVNSLRDDIDCAKASGNKQDIKNAKKEFRKARREGIVEGVDKYNTVKELMDKFKSAVGQDEYNYFDKELTFNGSAIDIIIKVAPDKTDRKEGKTRIPYIEGISVNFATKEESKIPVGIEMNAINIYLKKTNLSTIGNEMGDVKFGVERANTNYSERDKPYWEKKSTKFSFDYQDYVVRKRKEKPNPKNY